MGFDAAMYAKTWMEIKSIRASRPRQTATGLLVILLDDKSLPAYVFPSAEVALDAEDIKGFSSIVSKSLPGPGLGWIYCIFGFPLHNGTVFIMGLFLLFVSLGYHPIDCPLFH